MSGMPRISRQFAPIPIRGGRGLQPTPIPRPFTSFFGRERERAELAALVVQDDVHLVTLVGPAGVGKTRLALQVASELDQMFAVVAFVSLASAGEPAQIAPAVGKELGIREPTIERIAEQLGTAPSLLVLDNLEQIPGAAATLAHLMAACASVTLMTTSRSVLRVSDERVYPISPLTTDSEAGKPLAETPAIQLFAARARAADSAFTLNETNIAPIARICQQVDGLPLAIELAAGQVRVLTPQAILNRLDRRLDVLTHGPVDQPERQQDLERAIRWSYDLLQPAEQRFYRHLGVFSGGFTEEAAREIAQLGDSPALPELAALIDASLLIRNVQSDSESRYTLLDTIREFCLLELRAHDEEVAARQAHAAYYLQLAARAEPRLIVIGSADWVRRLAVEHANLRDAVEWSLAHDDPEPVLGLAGTLLSMVYARGEPAESGSWLERALERSNPEPTALLCDARFAASALAQVRGDFARSIDHATRSLEIARAAGYPFGEGRALLGLGISAEWARDLDLAEQRYRAARAIMHTLDSSTPLAHWRVLPVANLADIALIQRSYREAIELGSEAVAAWREAGYLWGVAQALGTVAAARCELGDLAASRRDYREALELWLACADGRGIAGTIAGIASIALHSGDPTTAAHLLGSAWGVRETLSLEYVAHHLYVEQVRAAVLDRGAANLDHAEAAGRTATLDDALAVAYAVLQQKSFPQRTSALALSAREREVLGYIMNGLHDREIADRLSISPRTVQSHVVSILNKLGARSRAEAVAIAIRSGLT